MQKQKNQTEGDNNQFIYKYIATYLRDPSLLLLLHILYFHTCLQSEIYLRPIKNINRWQQKAEKTYLLNILMHTTFKF